MSDILEYDLTSKAIPMFVGFIVTAKIYKLPDPKSPSNFLPLAVVMQSLPAGDDNIFFLKIPELLIPFVNQGNEYYSFRILFITCKKTGESTLIIDPRVKPIPAFPTVFSDLTHQDFGNASPNLN